jgi:hypothetical protein
MLKKARTFLRHLHPRMKKFMYDSYIVNRPRTMSGLASYCFPASLPRQAGATKNHKIHNLSGLCDAIERIEPLL